ncbi:hypothetical protein [Nonomuraea zeae]|uniref:PE domain-containing protein n=1 Tax=Nonomuraea zeae TaxID=1642303 RepID=A0A5S4G288_9ACTN|nr:hypothetical protein [Nonomuraea zeae]TMR27076.1 hypothetical protein ETD85_40330 [Nonomuraea zeae]
MGTDRGVDLSRRAIKAARTDLEEALALLRPDSDNGGDATPVLTQTGSVVQLNDDAEAMSGFWPAALGFQTSAGNGIRAVTTSYANIADQVESVIELFNTALRNYDNAEGGEDRRQV